jgi:hypothetical protein
MNVFAASVGSPRIPMNFQAEVHSVFSNVVNLNIRGTDTIVSILFRNENDQPGDIRIDSNQLHVIRNFVPGQVVRCQNGWIETNNSSVKISLDRAKLVECALIDQCDVDLETIKQALRVINVTLRERELLSLDTSLMGKQFYVKISRGLEELKQAISTGDPFVLDESVQQLIGLGAGLTPSGDDILVGLLAGFEISKTYDKNLEKILSTLRSLVLCHCGKTNQISCKYLSYAAHGYFSTYIIDLLTTISNEDSLTSMKNAANKVVMIGHTSGMDTLIGIATALEILLLRKGCIPEL